MTLSKAAGAPTMGPDAETAAAACIAVNVGRSIVVLLLPLGTTRD